MKISLEQYRNDPSIRIKLHAAVRRERAAAIQRFLITPLKAFLKGPERRPSRMLRGKSALAA